MHSSQTPLVAGASTTAAGAAENKQSPLPELRLRQILFPTDFSDSIRAAAPFAAELARQAGADVTILHVVPYMSAFEGVPEQHRDAWQHTYISDGAAETDPAPTEWAQMEAMRKQAFAGVPAEICLKQGPVGETIVKFAKTINADLIVMPSHARGPSHRFFIGSTAAKVLRSAPCPVLTTAHPKEAEPLPAHPHIVCAVNPNVPFAHLAVRAAQVATYLRGRLTFVAGVEGSGRSQLRQELKHTLATLPISAELEVVEGRVGEIVRQVATVDKAHLVIAGRGDVDGHIYEIIWHSPCPVLIV